MRVLLDTHVFLWALTDSPRLSPEARELLADAREVYVSAASVWEIAIKSALGRIDADPGEVVAAIQRSGFLELDVTARHAAGVAALPPYHNDPFDRLLLAQAIAEPLRFLSADALLPRYSPLVVPV